MGKMVGRSLTMAGALLALALSGCGDGGKESPHRGITAEETGAGKFGTDAGGVGFVGGDQCVGCHADVDDPGTANKVEGCTECHLGAPWAATWARSGEIVEKFLASPHVIHSARIDASDANESCNALCHDPVGDGRTLETLVDGAAVPAKGLSAVTCEACHGGGGRHFGKPGAIAKAPGYEVCGGCHSEAMPFIHNVTAVVNPDSLGIKEGYEASLHFNLPDTDAYPEYLAMAGTKILGLKAACAKCHTDEGAKHQALEGIATTEAVWSRVQCRTCHDPHNPKELLGIGSFTVAEGTARYKTCTFCHSLVGTTDVHVTENVFTRLGTAAPSVKDVTITDTHVAVGNNWESTRSASGATNVGAGINSVAWNEIVGTTGDGIAVAGYAFDPTSATDPTCARCHNLHRANVAKDEAEAEADPDASREHYEWAHSAHADRTGIGPWAHYNWSSRGNAVARSDCQRCHTTSGMSKYAEALQQGRPDLYTAPLRTTTGWKPEMLQCNGCHTSTRGDTWVLGTYEADYSFVGTYGSATKKVKYPEVGASGVCIPCHSGRLGGDTIKGIAELMTSTAQQIPGFQNSHYLPAAGVLFGKIGYDFGTTAITTTRSLQHQTVGVVGQTVADAEANGQGPCVTCHMAREVEDGGWRTNHGFEPVEIGTGGAITGVPEDGVCVKCHSAENPIGPVTAATLTEEKKNYHAALALAERLLADHGLYFSPNNPYFFRVPYEELQAALDANKTTYVAYSAQLSTFTYKTWSDVGINGLGAAFNFNLLEHEPGAYAHNKSYVQVLLQRTIDWANDGTLNGNWSTTLANPPAAREDLYLYHEYDAARARRFFGLP